MLLMMIIRAIGFIVARQAVCYSVGDTIHMLDGEVKSRDVFPPSHLSARQIRLSLEVLETLVVCNYDESSP